MMETAARTNGVFNAVDPVEAETDAAARAAGFGDIAEAEEAWALQAAEIEAAWAEHHARRRAQLQEELQKELQEELDASLLSPALINGRYEAGMILAGVACRINTDMVDLAGAVIRIYGGPGPRLVDSLTAKPRMPYGKAQLRLMRMASAISRGVALYRPQVFGRILAAVLSRSDRDELVLILRTYAEVKDSAQRRVR